MLYQPFTLFWVQMDLPLLNKLRNEGLISAESFEKTKERSGNKLLSIHWELKTLLYLDVMLLAGGLGILVYKNIDSIGHQAILLFIALVCIASFVFCFKYKLPFSVHKTPSPNSFFDYVLLLGCLMLITFIAYLQFQYNVFGSRYGMASFVPMIVLFFTAYYFDHLGILSMAITNLAAWLGFTVTPLGLLRENDFNSDTLIYTGIALGILLLVMAFITDKKGLKKHFAFTYNNFGLNVFFISCLAAIFSFDASYLLWFFILSGGAFYIYKKAFFEKSFYFLLMCTIYSYIAISSVVVRLLIMSSSLDEGMIYIGLLYFIISAIVLAFFLIKSNKKLKANDSI